MARSATNRFGRTLRQLRESREIGLRRLAAEVGISATYLSQIELGILAPPSAEKVEALARSLGQEPDRLVALAGRLPSDLEIIIRRRPREITALLRAVERLPASEVAKLVGRAARVEASSRGSQ